LLSSGGTDGERKASPPPLVLHEIDSAIQRFGALCLLGQKISKSSDFSVQRVYFRRNMAAAFPQSNFNPKPLHSRYLPPFSPKIQLDALLS
jgi:hypothetical protein